jgi:hypothetical protein
VYSCCSFAQIQVEDHSPQKASIYSAILPGAGQFYNKKYWKIPIIYGGIGAALYTAKINRDEYQHFTQALEYRTDGDETTIDPYVDRYTESNLITIKNYHRKNSDLGYIVAVGIYLLNIIDASVDAHLFNFNINDDLSLNVQPQLMSLQNKNIPSLSLKLNLN